MIDDGALTGFDGHGQRRKARGLLAPVLPAGFGMLKTELGHHLAGLVDDNDLMGALRPIKAGEVGDRGSRSHRSFFPVWGLGGSWCSGCLSFGPESN